MTCVNGGLGLRFLHLNASDLGSVPDSVIALLCDLGQIMSSFGSVKWRQLFCLPVQMANITGQVL